MKTNTEESSLKHRTIATGGGLAITALIALVLPLTQWVAHGEKTDSQDAPTLVAIQPPPPPPPEIEEPEQEEEQMEEPELNKEVQQLSLAQLDLALNTSISSDVTNGFNVGNFELSDAFDENLVFEIADLDEAPRAITQFPPKYPPALRRTGLEGKVLLIFIVDESGNVVNARAVKSDHPDFERSALDTVNRWRFKPGQKDGKAVKTRVRIPLSFNLKS